MFSVLSRAISALVVGIGLLLAGASLLAEAHPVAFWSSAAVLVGLFAWGVVLQRRERMERLQGVHVPSMNPVEYELFCARLLADAGWSTRHVGALGDQGVDVIAELRGVRVAVQAKKYSRPAGNAAVQEVAAGSRFHGCALGVVVAPNGHTRAAQQLADANGVMLLSHDDLPRLERLARVPLTP